ncbi:hypothetical protein M422DRAFT_784044 [Sphaerobolus stellatus SS14]|uniref:Uncharacterized protein n=1 Tax=Sphaerobolus stellatus (strain SS14) TaxID=990650 RepID=A0A0C9U7K0_SPHS4|nr:hypothetical protein M422DRAFT_784044 [Sphaerobolus stellatus SS14]
MHGLSVPRQIALTLPSAHVLAIARSVHSSSRILASQGLPNDEVNDNCNRNQKQSKSEQAYENAENSKSPEEFAEAWRSVIQDIFPPEMGLKTTVKLEERAPSTATPSLALLPLRNKPAQP